MYESVDVVAHKNRSPNALWTLTEAARAMSEVASFGATWSVHRLAPKGAGQPVMVLPGFLAGDSSTVLCRAFLRRQGFTAIPWELGQNTGQDVLQARLANRFLDVVEQFGEPLSLVGHSLGGVFARELARRYPQQVRSVVTLGSPFGESDGGSVTSLVRALFERMSGGSVRELRARWLMSQPHLPPGVPSTAIFSRADGVVHWRSCLEQASPLTENVEVFGSHCGLIANPSVLFAMADRLAQPVGEWRKLDERNLPRWLPYPKHRGMAAQPRVV